VSFDGLAKKRKRADLKEPAGSILIPPFVIANADSMLDKCAAQL
jgi:hypothetical protein